jgi:hypothetical protein
MIKALMLATVISISHFTLASTQTTEAADSVVGLMRPFGLGGHACKQYDDMGRLYIYSEGYPSIGVIAWLQQSDGGTKPNVPMPQELADALPSLPGCLPGKHHAAPQPEVGQEVGQIVR